MSSMPAAPAGDPSPGPDLAGLAIGSLTTSLLAVAIALPVAAGAATFTTYYAPRRLAPALGALVDLFAVVPGVVYGLWALHVLLPALGPRLAVTLVLAAVIAPVVAATCQDLLRRTPEGQHEAALALGASRWQA
ncbi:MAG: ABC transporter permease subunit, partial [Carbonactinosporaceae bacterium]